MPCTSCSSCSSVAQGQRPCGYPVFTASSMPHPFGAFFQPAVTYAATVGIPTALEYQKDEVVNGYPTSSYVHVNDQVALPAHFNLCNPSTRIQKH